MTITTKTPDQLTSDMVAAWAAFVGVTPVMQSGDGLLALFQSVSIELDFIQQQIQAVQKLVRAQTSSGADLDLCGTRSLFAYRRFHRGRDCPRWLVVVASLRSQVRSLRRCNVDASGAHRQESDDGQRLRDANFCSCRLLAEHSRQGDPGCAPTRSIAISGHTRCPLDHSLSDYYGRPWLGGSPPDGNTSGNASMAGLRPSHADSVRGVFGGTHHRGDAWPGRHG